MNIEYIKNLSYNSVRKQYRSYLEGLEIGRNAVSTITSDSFYLWNNVGQDEFWRVVLSDEFENEARNALLVALTEHSSGNANNLVNGYLSSLRRFRTFIFSKETDIAEDDISALKEFLLDIDCLEPLAKWTSSFNLFDILKISRVEIRHSNMLSWLLNPNENHGLGDSILRGFLQYIVSNFTDTSDIFSVLLMDCHGFIIQREWHHIDILAVNVEEKFVLCIENKIDSGEHDNQLNRYRTIVEDTYPDYTKMYIYLSPEGGESTDSDNWCSMGYQEVLAIIETAQKKVKLLPEVELLVQNYIDTIRRDIVGDENLAQICAEIYSKHQKALDLIFENKPDRASDLAAIFLTWAKNKTESGQIEVVVDKCAKSYTRFKTKGMSALLPDSKDSVSGWGTSNYYFYEIINKNNGIDFFIQLSLSSKDIPKELREMCDKINVLYPSPKNKKGWQWRTPFRTKTIKVEEELVEEKIFDQLDKKLADIMSFEAKLTEQINSPKQEKAQTE